MSLFPQNTAARTSSNLVEFRAGRMNLNGTTVTADPRKGLVYLLVKPDDQFLHFVWKDRTSGAIEEDLILFPDDAEWKKVTQCTTGRVYLLRFKDNSRKLFFWLQEPKTDKDKDYFERVNKVLSSPTASLPTLFSSSSASSALSGQGDLLLDPRRPNRASRAAASATANNAASPTSLAAAASSNNNNNNTATPAPSTTSAAPSANSATSATSDVGTQLANALAAVQAQQSASRDQLSLTQILNQDALELLLSNDQVVQQLLPHLPEGVSQNASELRATARSPQFHQALQAFTAALQAGNLNTIMSQFGIDASAAGTAQGVEAFLRALQNSSNNNNSGSNSKSGDSQSGGDPMNL